MKKPTKTKVPPKLSPQEDRVHLTLKGCGNSGADVGYLYAMATQRIGTKRSRIPHRKMQQHVGVLIARINKKRRRTIIVPGGKKLPHTYVIRRRR